VVPNFLGGGVEADFAASSPRLEVPSLIDGDTTVFDSTIILEYLEDKWPTPALRPQQPFERARVRMLEELEDTYHEAINWGLAEIRVFGRATGELADRMVARAGQQIAGIYQRLERELSRRQFFNGERFGWGDICVYPYVAGSIGWGFAPPADSRLSAWLTRMTQRASVAKCAAAATEAMAGFQNLQPIIEQGLFVREYRDHRLEWMLRTGGEQIVRDGMAKKNIRFSVEFS
jgi:glutathione S-transferase